MLVAHCANKPEELVSKEFIRALRVTISQHGLGSASSVESVQIEITTAVPSVLHAGRVRERASDRHPLKPKGIALSQQIIG
jgi:hypothetical protein